MTNLRIPGPTPCPPPVLEALSQQMINHRGPEFANLLARVTDGLRPFLQTNSDILILTCSGTGVMEAAVVNTLSPGDSVLAVSIGAFGERFADIADAYGASVERMDIEWGAAADPDAIASALRRGNYKAVIVTHNETSTGVTNPLQSIAEVIHAESDALILVDAVSSLGCVSLPIDDWGLDVVVTGSQKGWEVPPGLGMAVISEKAWEANKTARMPRFYLDFKKHKELAAQGQTPFTPALPIMYALDVSLQRMAIEGPEAIFARHARIAEVARDSITELGLELFAQSGFASDTVTAVKVPDGIDGKAIIAISRKKHDTVFAGGQARLAGQIFRLGHLGWVKKADILDAVFALRCVLTELDFVLPNNETINR